MVTLWLKSFKRLLSVILFFFILIPNVFSQALTSPVHWHHSVYEARVSAMGQATAALDNRTSYHINPAVPSENGVISFSSFLFSTSSIESPTIPNGAQLYSPAVSFSNGRFSYSAMMDYTSYYLPPNISGWSGDISNSLFRFQSGFQLATSFSIGAGISYSSYKSPTFGNGQYDGDATAWGVTIGAHYQSMFEAGRFFIEPQVGLSINDISNGFKHETEGPNAVHMPGQIRLGVGLSASNKNLYMNLPLFGGGIYTGFSKYLTRMEFDNDTYQVTISKGVEALFNTWGSFEIFEGPISFWDQISTSVGVELHFLETLYARYGLVGGADYWIRPENGFGVEIDLYYISFAYTRLNRHSSDVYHWQDQYYDKRYGPHDQSTFIQATFRIPVDGKPRDTLLGRLFTR